MKAKIHFVLFFIGLFGFSISSKAVSVGQVVGQVLEKETQKPIAFAEVILENSMDKIVVTANEYGYYYANHIPTGKYQMRVAFNNRVFIMNKVRVFDGYSNEVNFIVSSNSSLPEIVELENREPVISAFTSNDIVLRNSSNNQPTRSLSEALSTQPGVDVINGKLYVKGSSQVRFFIDGTPVMGPPVLQRIW